MTAVILLREMVDAGVEALQENRDAGQDDEHTAIAVYLAMEGIKKMALAREIGSVH